MSFAEKKKYGSMDAAFLHGLKHEVGDKVEYTGKGFIGYCPKDSEMTILEVKMNDFVVDYYGRKILVRNYEVK
jgi:hypothetical protein